MQSRQSNSKSRAHAHTYTRFPATHFTSISLQLLHAHKQPSQCIPFAHSALSSSQTRTKICATIANNQSSHMLNRAFQPLLLHPSRLFFLFPLLSCCLPSSSSCNSDQFPFIRVYISCFLKLLCHCKYSRLLRKNSIFQCSSLHWAQFACRIH